MKILTFTESALSQLRKQGLIKFSVTSKGCSGLKYQMEQVNEQKDEEVIIQDGVKVLVCPSSVFKLLGTKVDYKQTDLEQRFIFLNPNAQSECGCGKSFKVY